VNRNSHHAAYFPYRRHRFAFIELYRGPAFAFNPDGNNIEAVFRGD
jgi:hypothetical protein